MGPPAAAFAIRIQRALCEPRNGTNSRAFGSLCGVAAPKFVDLVVAELEIMGDRKYNTLIEEVKSTSLVIVSACKLLSVLSIPGSPFSIPLNLPTVVFGKRCLLFPARVAPCPGPRNGSLLRNFSQIPRAVWVATQKPLLRPDVQRVYDAWLFHHSQANAFRRELHSFVAHSACQHIPSKESVKRRRCT